MKLGKRVVANNAINNPNKTNSTKNIAVIVTIVVALLLIIWVYMLGKKAEETVDVLMWTQDISKNQMITADMVTTYPMVKAEFDKYAVENKNGGAPTRRLALAEEAERTLGLYAAYPLHENTLVFYTDLTGTRTDNTDTVLYSFPGKDIIQLDVDSSALSTFKTFLQPGDRVNVTALYTIENSVRNVETDREEKIKTIKEEQFLSDILIADMLNSNGQSILDIMTVYNTKSTQQQTNMQNSDAFKKQTEPKSLLIALSPEEKTRYYQYLAKDDVEFKISLPQREK